MSESNNHRLQELFLAALEVPAEEREAWLAEQCGEDEQLLADVRELLAHDEPSQDPLEQGLDAALGGIPTTLIPDPTADNDAGDDRETEAIAMDSQLFLSKLTEVGVLSAEELEELSATVAEGQSDSDPRKLASQLVSDGKLTEYQASALLNGQPDLLLDKYLILDLIGAGGMGMVFKAIHRPMSRTVAVKMISQQLLGSDEQVKRFQREVRVAATLEHPNIVRAYDADQANGVHFLVLEYVRGETLAQTVRRDGPLPLKEAVDAIMQAARGLGYAHEQGIVHRDVKPANLMRSRRGVVKVLDLGLANVDESFRLVQQSSAAVPGSDPAAYEPSGSDLTQAGAVLGTVSYMAPEQSLRANAADARSDVYALGCTLYFLLTGEPPYAGETVFEVFAQHRDGEIPSLRDKRPDVPTAIEAVCHRMLAKAPDDRYQSMDELIAALQACGIAAPEDPAKPSSGKSQRTTRTIAPDVQPRERSDRHQNWWRTWAILLFVLIGGSYAMSLLMGPWDRRNRSAETETSDVARTTVSNMETRSVSEGPNTALSEEPQNADPRKFALAFDGDGDDVELPRMGFTTDQPVTMEVWYEIDELNETNGACLVMLDQCLWIESYKNGTWQITAYAEEGGYYRGVYGEKQIVGRPVHMAAIYDGSRFRLFVDGNEKQLEHVRFFDDGNGYQTLPVLGDLTLAQKRWKPATLLGKHSVSGTQQTFRGRLFDVRLSLGARYTEDFTPQERFDVDEQTFALYRFDEGQGDVLHDSSGNGHHGTIHGAKWVKVDDQETRSVSEGQGNVTRGVGEGPNTAPSKQPDEAEPSAADLLATGEYEWRVVERLPEPTINTEQVEASGHISADGLTLVFSRGSAGNDQQLWIAERDSTDAAWSTPQKLGIQVNLAPNCFNPHLSSDGLTMWFSAAPSGLMRTHVTSRQSRESAWETARQFEVNDGWQESLFVSTDQRTLLSSHTSTGVGPRLFISQRTSLEQPWPEPTRFSLKAIEDAKVSRGSISDDGRLLILNLGQHKNWIWMARRPNADADWRDPVPVSKLNMTAYATNPVLLADGQTILFACQDKPGDSVSQDLYFARLVRKDAPVEPIKGLEEPPPVDSAAEETAEPSGADLLATGEYEWQIVEELPPPISAGLYDSSADMTDNGLTVVYVSNAAGGEGDRDLWMIQRPALDAPWGKPVNLGPTVNSSANEESPSIDGDGRTLVFVRSSSRAEHNGMISTRDSTDAPWSEAVPLLVSRNLQPDVTSNGLSIVTKKPHGQSSELLLATRQSRGDRWSNLQLMGQPVNSDAHEHWGTMSDDGRLLVIQRYGQGIQAGLYMSTRADTYSPWSEPELIETINSHATEERPRVLDDGRKLVYMSERSGVPKLYVAELKRKLPEIESESMR